MVNNTKYGSGALQNNSGKNNTAIGAYASCNNSGASNNTAIGSNTSFYNTTGSNNTSLGSGSLCNNTTGAFNTAIGSSALEGVLPTGSIGDQNTAIGAQALYTNQGDLNTAIGAYSALGLTGGSYNTFLGANTSATQPNFNYSTAIGYNAVVDDSNQIMMGGNASGSYPNVVIPGLANYTTYTPGSYNSDTLVPKQYVDQFVSGISIKGPVTAISLTDVSGGYIGSGPGSITGVTPIPLVIDGVTIQDGSGVLLNGQTDPSHNGVYTWDSMTATLTRKLGIQNGESAVAAYVFVREGTYAKTAWVQINNPAIVGNSSLNFVQFNNFDYKLGRGLESNNSVGVTTIDVDTSLNFINFLDSTTGITGANGRLALGTYTTNNIVIGPTGTSVPIQAQSIIQAQKGITGATGSFNNLCITNNAQFLQDISVNTMTIGLGGGQVSTNTSLGVNALQSNTTGQYNTSLGYQALQSNKIQTDMIAIGFQALQNATSSSHNIGIGYRALQNNQGVYNLGIGYQTLINNIGGQNMALGYDALGSNTSGSNNMALGYGTLSSNTSGSNNIAIGVNSIIYNQTGSYNTSIGVQALQISTASNNTAIGYCAGSSNTTFSNSTAIGANSQLTNSNQVMLGGLNSGIYPQVVAPGGITGPAGSFTYLNSSNNTYLATTNGIVTIGKSTANNGLYILDVSGNGVFSGSVTAASFNNPSDYRIKENVIPLDDKFIVDSLIPVTYMNKLTEKQDIGLIAHELQEVYPFLVNGEKDGKDFQSVNYTGLIALLIKEIKELKQRVKALEDKSSI